MAEAPGTAAPAGWPWDAFPCEAWKRGMKTATPMDSSAAMAAYQKISLKASTVGSAKGPTCTTAEVSTTPTTADMVEVPTARSSEFSPLADAVSVIGTERMISVGMAA